MWIVVSTFSSLWCKTKPQTGVLDSKRGVEGSTAIRKTMQASAKSMTWMKQMDEGKWKWLGCDLWQAVRNQCQLLWMGNHCWANEKKKEKKELTFFIRHPRIINRVQAFWWGWKKPQDTWLTSHRRGEQWNTEWRNRTKKGVLLGDKVKIFVTVSYEKRAGETKSGVKTENCQEGLLKTLY